MTSALRDERAPADERLTARTAIVHDWFQGFHGAERLVDTIRADVFAPDRQPDIFTFHAARELLPADLARTIVKESWLARLPGIRQRGHDQGRWRYLLPYMPTYFRRLSLESYDVVVSSSHACALHARPRRDAVHAAYCYTPMRYAWLQDTERERLQGVRGRVLRLYSARLRALDRAAAQRPDAFGAISTAVRDRIRLFYGRDATVIHPPVDVHELRPHDEKEEGHFLWVHRLVPYKRPDIVAEAFRGTSLRLTMVGVGPLDRRLRANLPKNVELRGWVDREELTRLYARAAGFIHLGEEDFGITMVEALGSGTPVIAIDAGGARDIVRDGEDGLLIEPTVDNLRRALTRTVETRWRRDALVARAEEFSRKRFSERFGDWLRSLGAG